MATPLYCVLRRIIAQSAELKRVNNCLGSFPHRFVNP
jgi:hypothetical protein